VLTSLGWQASDGSSLTSYMAMDVTRDTGHLLHVLGTYEPRPAIRAAHQPTPRGVTFARAALRTWPGDTATR